MSKLNGEFNNIIKSLKQEYKHWHTNQIDFQTNKYSRRINRHYCWEN
jgi:hypothetical protein